MKCMEKAAKAHLSESKTPLLLVGQDDLLLEGVLDRAARLGLHRSELDCSVFRC